MVGLGVYQVGEPKHWAPGGGEAYLAMRELGTPDEDITLVVDVEAHLDTRWAAIRAHHSQPSPYDDLVPELQHEFLAFDRLRVVRGAAHPDRQSPKREGA